MLRIFQPWLAALFLFSGMFKGVVPMPVDWTVLLGAMLCLSLLPDWRDILELRRHPATWLFTALILWLVVSGWPLSEFGRYKIAESVAFGVPAMAAGFVLSRRDSLASFGQAVAWAGVPVTAIAVINAVTEGTVSQSTEVLSGGYQLTATMLAVGLLYAFIVDRTTLRWPLIATLILGLGVVGSIIPFYSSIMLGVGLLAVSRRWRDAAVSAGLVVVIMLAATFAMGGAPGAVARIAWKMDILQEKQQVGDAPSTTSAIAAPAVTTQVDGITVDATDRPYIFRQAFDLWRAAPLFGHGFGSIEYVDGYRTAHNIVLELAAEGGIVAAVLFLAFALSAGWPLLIACRERPYELALFLTLMLASMVGGYFIGRLQMFAIGAALSATATRCQTSARPAG